MENPHDIIQELPDISTDQFGHADPNENEIQELLQCLEGRMSAGWSDSKIMAWLELQFNFNRQGSRRFMQKFQRYIINKFDNKDDTEERAYSRKKHVEMASMVFRAAMTAGKLSVAVQALNILVRLEGTEKQIEGKVDNKIEFAIRRYKDEKQIEAKRPHIVDGKEIKDKK